MKNFALILLLAITAQFTFAQQSGKDKAPKSFARLAPFALDITYLGEFKGPDGRMEARWKAVGTLKNIGNTTYSCATSSDPDGRDFYLVGVLNGVQFPETQGANLSCSGGTIPNVAPGGVITMQYTFRLPVGNYPKPTIVLYDLYEKDIRRIEKPLPPVK